MGDFFDKRADEYDEHMFRDVAGAAELYHNTALCFEKTDKPVSVLDLGCGTGLELVEIYKIAPNAQVTGIDLSKNMLNLLEKRFGGSSNKLELVNASYLDYNFGEQRFDYVVSVMSLHHFSKEQKRKLYKKILQSLKTGGKYVEGDYTAADECEEALFAAKCREDENGRQSGFYHLDMPFTANTQMQLLKQAGFSQCEISFKIKNAAVFTAISKPQ